MSIGLIIIYRQYILYNTDLGISLNCFANTNHTYNEQLFIFLIKLISFFGKAFFLNTQNICT